MQKKLYLLAVIFFLGFCFNPVSADEAYEKAKVLFDKKKYSKALQELNFSNSNTENRLNIMFLKGLLQIQLGYVQEASKTFQKLAIEYPNNPEIHNNLAVIYNLTNDLMKAEASLKDALNTNPSYKTAYENLGKLYAQKAGEAYRRAIQQKRSTDTQKIQLALLFDITGNNLLTSQETGLVAKDKKLKATEDIILTSDKETTNDDTEIFSTVMRWASAWETKNVEEYLSFYSPSFRPTKTSWNEWAAVRKSRITSPKMISLLITDLKILSKSKSKIVVRFKQAYKSNFIESKGIKTLTMTREQQRWLILKEVFSKPL